ncbi:MAG: sulfotransferase [Rhodothermales bacterium]|nr:sulfotransferase [Rhodothermales bacterium]
MVEAPIHNETSEALAAGSSVDWRREPIFIVGIMPRSGTNFLHRLLCQHPDCGAINTTPVREDYLLHHIEGLNRYVGRLRWQWGHWGADEGFVQALADRLGLGAAAFLKSLSGARRIVTKTPSVANLNLFARYFRHSPLLVIVRDGRSVVASGMSGFGWKFETATREWAAAARAIARFRERGDSAAFRFQVVQYERLSAETSASLQDIFTFLELDANRYDFEKAGQTPIYGSSFESKEGEALTWKPKEKPANFDAGARWTSWSRFQRERFDWLAGDELTSLGYERETHGGARLPWGVLNRLLDGWYHVSRMPRRLARSVREASKAFVTHLSGRHVEKADLRR